MLDITLYEAIDLALSVAGFAIILFTSIRLFRCKAIPGSRIIFIAVIGAVIGALSTLIEVLFFVPDSNYLFESVLEIYMAGMFLLAAIGFWRLVSYTTSHKASEQN